MLIRWLIEYVLNGGQIMAKLEALTQEISEVRGTVASAIVLIQSLADRIKACECDPFKLSALVADLNESQETLAAAVAAHTEPVVPVEPDPEPVVPDEDPVDLEPDTITDEN